MNEEKKWVIVWRDETSLGHDKCASIRELAKGRKIIFIGDGVSDIPAAKEVCFFAKDHS